MKQTSEMLNIAIVVVAYNRADSVRRLLNSLLEAYYSQSAPLIISIDKSNTDAVEKLADEFQWPYGEKIVAKHPKNLGLRRHILSIGNYLEEFDALIVLEDDIDVSPNFYSYAVGAVGMYKECDNIAGISLFNFPVSYHNKLPFYPIKNETDAFLMQIAMSWGQVWMKAQWLEFKRWYDQNNEEFKAKPHLPSSICSWPKSSWLKYHSRYCIEKNKFFVYPYVSLSTNSSDAGEHQGGASNLYQAPLQYGEKRNYIFPDFDSAVKYDGFFENLSIQHHLGIEDLCVDLYMFKCNSENRRYWLTTRKANFKIVKSYALQYIPIEINILKDKIGNDIFLYDTHIKEAFVGNKNSVNRLCRTLYYTNNSLRYLQLYGALNVLLDLYHYTKFKLLKK